MAIDIVSPFGDFDKLLVGTVETTVRPVLNGRWVLQPGHLPWQLWVDAFWDLGVNVVRNKNNETAGWDAELVGSLVVMVRRLF